MTPLFPPVGRKDAAPAGSDEEAEGTGRPTGRGRKLLRSLIVVGLLGGIAALGVFAAFSATTTNAGNSLAAGTVDISDNDAGAAMYGVSNQKPGDTVTRCIQVTYTGTLDSDVKLYTPSSIGSVGPYVSLTITPGTQAVPSFPNCTGFTPDAGGDLYSGTLAGFASAYTGYANGLADYPGAGTRWTTNDAVVYRFTLTLQDNNAAAGLNTGAHSFTWESRNQ